MRLINQRKTLLAYLKKTNTASYETLIDKLGLRK
jgi:ribosomal protein S15P/S13E